MNITAPVQSILADLISNIQDCGMSPPDPKTLKAILNDPADPSGASMLSLMQGMAGSKASNAFAEFALALSADFLKSNPVGRPATIDEFVEITSMKVLHADKAKSYKNTIGAYAKFLAAAEILNPHAKEGFGGIISKIAEALGNSGSKILDSTVH